jgi:monoamine oxidase
MPNLYTSLLARRIGTNTLAPKNGPFPVPQEIDTQPNLEFTEDIFNSHKNALAKIVGAGAKPFAPPGVTGSIGIIGAGLAGLSAGYELATRGYSVTILEASDRIGGRTWANHDFVKPHTMDRGAELIGSNHPLWLNYQRVFKIGFTDVVEYENSPIILDGQSLTREEEDELGKEMDGAFAFISAAAKGIFDPYRPWTDPQALILDRQNVYDFIMKRNWSDRCKKAVLQQLESDNGVTAKKQSLLALLTMVNGGGSDRYWVDTEVYRSKRGTQVLSEAFGAALRGWGLSINYNSRIIGVDGGRRKVELQVKRRARRIERMEFDNVILTVPPSAWKTITTWKPKKLASFMSSPPQMGKNVKCLLSFADRFWRAQDLAPSSTASGPVDQTWETTEAFESPEFAGMVAFAGAKHAADLSKLSDTKAKARIIDSLEDVYKGISSKVTQSEFVNWPKRKWSKASYSFPNCGDIMKWGPKFNDGYDGKLHFAGEHTCYAFTGYMEGALQSGYRLARKIVSRDGGRWIV